MIRQILNYFWSVFIHVKSGLFLMVQLPKYWVSEDL